MSDFLGVRFITHPPQCPVDFQVKKIRSIPLCRALQISLFHRDEHYQLEVLSDELELFAETASAAGTYPAGLTRTYGEGCPAS